MRCPECGHNNPDNLGQCQVCRTTMQAPQNAARRPVAQQGNAWNAQLNARQPDSAPAARTSMTPTIYQQSPLPDNMPSSHGAGLLAASTQPASQNHADVTGRVIAAEAPILERPDFDLCRVLTRTLWLMLLVVSPLMLLHAILTTMGGFSALLALVGLLFFARFLSPSNLFTMYHLAALANPFGSRNGAEQVPVRYVRVRGNDNDSEYVVRMKGNLTLGNLMADDLVSFWGRWQRGVLHARHAYSHRTQTWVEFQRSYSWLTLAATVCVILLLAGYFYGPVSHLFMRVQELGIAR